MMLSKLFNKPQKIALMATFLLCCSSAQATGEDPWENMNRKVFVFNETVDKYFLKPIAKTYQWVIPKPLDHHITNVFDNLQELGIFLNNTLQAKFPEAVSDASRFVINSTVGVAGIFDVATPLGLKKHNEDFGQTFAAWKVGPGPYMVLPFLGPSTLRDAVGLIPDAYTLPQKYIDHVPTRNSVYILDSVDTRADLLSLEKLIQGDKYSFIRDIYLQRRKFLISDGEIEDDFAADELYEE